MNPLVWVLIVGAYVGVWLTAAAPYARRDLERKYAEREEVRAARLRYTTYQWQNNKPITDQDRRASLGWALFVCTLWPIVLPFQTAARRLQAPQEVAARQAEELAAIRKFVEQQGLPWDFQHTDGGGNP